MASTNSGTMVANNLPEFQKFLDMAGSRTPVKSVQRSDNRHPTSLAAVRVLQRCPSEWWDTPRLWGSVTSATDFEMAKKRISETLPGSLDNLSDWMCQILDKQRRLIRNLPTLDAYNGIGSVSDESDWRNVPLGPSAQFSPASYIHGLGFI